MWISLVSLTDFPGFSLCVACHFGALKAHLLLGRVRSEREDEIVSR